jgi:hypothetical protein
MTIDPALLQWVFSLILVQWPALVGIAALVTCLVGIGKAVGWVTDGTSQSWSAGLNLIGMVVVLLLHIFQPSMDLTFLDTQAGLIAQILIVISGLVLQIFTSKGFYTVLKGVPVIGTSFSLQHNQSYTK